MQVRALLIGLFAVASAHPMGTSSAASAAESPSDAGTGLVLQRGLEPIRELTLGYRPLQIQVTREAPKPEIPKEPPALTAHPQARLTLKLELVDLKKDRAVLLQTPAGPEIVKRDLDEPGAFLFEVPFSGTETELRLMSVSASGKVQEEVIRILYPDYSAHLAQANEPPPPRLWHAQAGLGATYLNLKQPTRLEDACSQLLTTLKAGYQQRLGAADGPWQASASGYFAFLPMGGSCVSRSGQETTARYLGLNARVSYDPRWRLGNADFFIAGGFYYLTMFVPTQDFGFKNLSGPQIYPTVSLPLGSMYRLGSYLKISPVASQLSLLSLSNREVAWGLKLDRPLSDGRRVAATLDLSQLKLGLSSASGIFNQITTTTVSLGAQYEW